MTNTRGIKTTGVVTMHGNKVMHNTCNMAICDLPDMYALSPRGYISGKFPMAMLQVLPILKI